MPPVFPFYVPAVFSLIALWNPHLQVNSVFSSSIYRLSNVNWQVEFQIFDTLCACECAARVIWLLSEKWEFHVLTHKKWKKRETLQKKSIQFAVNREETHFLCLILSGFVAIKKKNFFVIIMSSFIIITGWLYTYMIYLPFFAVLCLWNNHKLIRIGENETTCKKTHKQISFKTDI